MPKTKCCHSTPRCNDCVEAAETKSFIRWVIDSLRRDAASAAPHEDWWDDTPSEGDI